MAKKSVTKSRVVTGSTKKSGLSLNKRTALFALVGILAFSSVAGIAWQKWQDHNLKAKAFSYQTVATNGQLTLKACVAPNYVYVYGINNSNYSASLDTTDGHFTSARAHANTTTQGVFPKMKLIFSNSVSTLNWTVSIAYLGRC